jgi:eukaryotic-like serine/threonine-protein kinase
MILARCNGIEHIVRMDTPFREETVTYLPMEYLDGNSLADRNERILSEKQALNYIRQISEALVVVHKQGLVHCDIRPANIFLRQGGKDVVLADFGLTLDVDTELSRTRDSEYIDGFSPIELCNRGQAIGAYTDVYSLAATLYELLTGEVPVSAKERKINSIQLISPRTKNPEISASTNKAILAGMQFMPEKRPQSVKDWLEKFNFEKQLTSPNPINWDKWNSIATWVGSITAAIAFIWGVFIFFQQQSNSNKTQNPSTQVSPK